MTKYIEFKKGIVKKTPIQNPIKPRQTIIILTISNPNKTKKCLETIVKLPFIASKAGSFPKIIRGMVKKVKNEMIELNSEPINLIPEASNVVLKPNEKIEMTVVAINKSLK